MLALRMCIIQTRRLVLRNFSLTDQEAMEALFGNPEVMFFGDGVQTSEWVGDWLEQRIHDARQHPERGLWAVTTANTDEAIGYCGLTYYPNIDGQGETEIGYRLARPHWGKGYATEAARAVRDYAFHQLGLTRLIAMIDPANAASIRVAEKLQLRYEKDVMLPGYTHPDRVYVVERHDGE